MTLQPTTLLVRDTPRTDAAGTTSQVAVLRAGVEDADLVRTMLIELATHERTAHAVHSTSEDWQRMLGSEAVVVLIAYLDDEPVGYVSGIRQLNLWVGHDILAMDDLYVRAEARDRGVGNMLMAALAEVASQGDLLVTWGVRSDNDAGHRFYQRLGATLRTKVVASWRPEDYRAHLDAAHERKGQRAHEASQHPRPQR
ncbi:GNAT family N-acetyltransferase [Nocardioides marmoribigeumensis]|uniref:Ribosomal protein S18 acetylase RimI-like enzyme n=1 Tax=Nocardioides marmoribigeumensis TaxID=433649 RepID=A0ABU2BU11_9ACTN|nr:GNAT family N-acetyltransferase [Nocardioides marmoribigeumensis]MDR7362115.1 ribosomal protein S18 acetylase RimI-like enzyme [Nocardioides marmoribigeumensis]